MYCGAGSVTKMNPRRGAIGSDEPASRAISPAHVPVALIMMGEEKFPWVVSIPMTREPLV